MPQAILFEQIRTPLPNGRSDRAKAYLENQHPDRNMAGGAICRIALV
jgi:hypothetical protein